MADIYELNGQLLALRAFVASLLEVMPLATRVQFASRLDRNLFLLRPCQPGRLLTGFDREIEALAVKRRSQLDRDLGAAHGEERRTQSRHG